MPKDVTGRGYSQAPQIPHEPNVYSFQLAFLLQYIGWTKVNVVGFSMVCPPHYQWHDYVQTMFTDIYREGP